MRRKRVAQPSPAIPPPTTIVGYMSEQIEFVGDVVAPVEVEWGPFVRKRQARGKRAGDTFDK